MLKTVSKAILKSLLLTALIMLPGILLLGINEIAGILWMGIGSFLMLANNYRKEFRLNPLTITIPALATTLSYLVQLYYFKIEPNLQWTGLALIAGILLGILRGRVHKVYTKDGRIFAQRTAFYLLIWLFTYAITQGFAMAKRQDLLAIGSASGAFSTILITIFSIIMLVKYSQEKDKLMEA